MDDEIKEWLSMLLGPVDITSEKAESYLKDFLTTKMGGVTKLYAEHIKRDVSVTCGHTHSCWVNFAHFFIIINIITLFDSRI